VAQAVDNCLANWVQNPSTTKKRKES
jgi:hypothetical protein